MRYILWLLLFSTLLFSDQKQIVFGCYLNKSNAIKEVSRLKSVIQNDDSLTKISLKNNLVIKMKDIDGYNVVTLGHFEHYPQLFLTMDILKKYYKELYALDYPLKADMLNLPKKTTEVVKKPKKQIDKKIDTILKEKVTPKEEVKSKPIFDEQQDVSTPEVEQKKNSSLKYIFYMVSSILFIIILVFVVLFFKFKKVKRKK